jgi:hypothetical protein
LGGIQMSKKGFIKGMVFGIIICTMLSISVTVFAKSISKQISVIFNSVKVYNDTKLMEFKDAKGNNIEPFIYNGDVYIPPKAQ